MEFPVDTANASVPLMTPQDLAARLGQADAPLLLDVRPPARFSQSPRMIAGAVRCAPGDVAAFATTHAACEVVVYCVYGHEVSTGAAVTLRRAGWPAVKLAGGMQGGEDGVDDPADIARWRAVVLPTQPNPQAGL
jgi:rhodanese-related sulfurtransferase